MDYTKETFWVWDWVPSEMKDVYIYELRAIDMSSVRGGDKERRRKGRECREAVRKLNWNNRKVVKKE